MLAQGSYIIDINNEKSSVNVNVESDGVSQSYPVADNIPFVQVVKLYIKSNYGNKDFTCLYRFKVHGDTQLSF